MKKSRYDQWAKLTGPSVAPSLNEVATIHIKDCAGVDRLEDLLLLYGSPSGQLPHIAEHVANSLSEALFGITERQTYFDPDDEYEYDDYDDRYDEHEARFETPDLDDFATVEFLRKFGLDFMDKNGRPLRCTFHFRRQAEAAAKGIAGRMPDRVELVTENWANSLEADAKAFLAKRRRSTA